MKKYLKYLIILFILVLGVASLTGCGKKEKTPEIDRTSIVGKWKYKNGGKFIYTFNKDGTGTYEVGKNVMKFTYKTDKDKLSILYDGDTESFDTTYSIEKDILNVKDSLGEDTLYKRMDE